jgi:hypothetical protein
MSTTETKLHRREVYIATTALVVSFVAAGLSAGQIWEAHHSGKVSQRAWVGVESSIIVDNPAIHGMRFTIKSIGNSPALKLRVKATCGANHRWKFPMPDESFIDYRNDGMMLPGASDTYQCALFSKDINENPHLFASPDQISNEKGTWIDSFMLMGTVKYLDIFGEEHETNFCYMESASGPQACKDNNSAY